jgi:hypothetical protein
MVCVAVGCRLGLRDVADGGEGVWPCFIGQCDPGDSHGHRHYTGDAGAGLGTFTVPSIPAKPHMEGVDHKFNPSDFAMMGD